MNYILAKHNFWQLVHKKVIVYREAPEYVLDYLRHKGSTVIHSETRPENAVLIKGTGYDWPTKEELGVTAEVENDVPEDYEVVQFVGNTAKGLNIYRRQKLNAYLKKHYKVATVYKGSVDTSNCKFIIISDPREADELIEKAQCPIYYDKTDMWDALVDGIDEAVLNKATGVFCSSRFIYANTEHKNKVLLENAANYYQYPFDRVYEKENIAVYVGRAENKVDVEYCDKLRQEHPDFKFVSIGLEIPGFENIPAMNWEDMMKYLQKCKVGLVPLKDNAYTAGQFNLKVWDYILNKMPVIVTNDYNYKNIKNVHKEWTTEFVEEPITYWNSVFDKILSYIEEDTEDILC